jgi:hypothetical protein
VVLPIARPKASAAALRGAARASARERRG